MKFLLSIFFVSCLMIETFAQITLDSSDFPIAGVKLPRVVGFLWGGTAGDPGAGQTYDFSNTSTIWQDTISYFGVGQTPYFNEHPGASVADFEWWRDAFLLIWYYTADNNAIWASGVTAIGDFGQGDTAIHANYLPPYTDTLLSTDYVYGNTETEFSTISIPLNSTWDLKLTSFKFIEVDGWGTLQTSFNNWDSILRVRYIEFNYDTLFVSGIPDTTISDTLFYYKYFAKGVRHPVVIAHTNFLGDLEYLEYIYTGFPPVIFGCTDSLAINFNPLASQDDNSCVYCNPINYTITPDTGICAGNNITLTINGGTTHLWSTGDTTNSILVSPDSTTLYSVYLSDTSACWELATVKVEVYKDVQAGFWVDPIMLSDSVLFVNTSTGATDYFWNFDDTQNGTSTEKNPRHLYSTAGTKNVMLIASNPCSVDTFYTTIIATSIDENLTGFSNLSVLKIYPNPGKDNAHISFHLNDNATVELSLIELYGRKRVIISKTEMTSGAHKFYFESNDPASGIYIVQLKIDGFNHQQKWVKIR